MARVNAGTDATEVVEDEPVGNLANERFEAHSMGALVRVVHRVGPVAGAGFTSDP